MVRDILSHTLKNENFGRGLAPSCESSLKEWVKVIITYNINASDGLTNGTVESTKCSPLSAKG